jgi:hypothetical protein
MRAADCDGNCIACEVSVAYAGPAFGISGTIDLLVTHNDTWEPPRITIADWKTGFESPGEARECIQLYAYAWIDHTPGVAQTIELRWLKDDGTVEVSSVAITADEIAAFGAELEAIAARLDAGGIEPVPGEHCERCPARINCPAHNTLLTKAAGGMGIDFDARSILARGIQSDAEARGVYHAINAVKHALPMLEEHLRAYAREYGPVEVNPGVHLVASTQTRRSVLDTPQAMEIIQKELVALADKFSVDAAEVLKAGVVTKVSQGATIGSLEKASSVLGMGGHRALFEALEKAGVIDKKPSFGLKTVKEGWNE